MKEPFKPTGKKWLLIPLFIILCAAHGQVQTAMINLQSRQTTSLNGEWRAIIDPSDSGEYRQVWLEQKPRKKTDFFETSFEGAPLLKVPGDFNSQMRELTYYEGIVWYKRQFGYSLKKGKRLFIHFGAVNYLADVFLNGEKIGSHEGGFTPFQFEITDKVKEGQNYLIVKADNRRLRNGLPGAGYDWFNYGGITREVDLIETDSTFVRDYFIQLKPGSLTAVSGWIRVDGPQPRQDIAIEIPELGLSRVVRTDEDGFARVEFESNFQLWSPENPKLYEVLIRGDTDLLTDTIGFRSIEVVGSRVLLNKEPIFLKAVNVHEENPHKGARAYSRDDARLLLESARELGCNFVRLVHYPHNEHMVKEAEKMGMMVWSELPVYQHIQFSDSLVPHKLRQVLHEMVNRDKNRCGVVVWSLSNETYPGTPRRTEVLIELTQQARALDSTRLITHVMNTHRYEDNTFHVSDPLYNHSDLVAINEYIGWYVPWQGRPSDTKWRVAFPDKPLFISEFGGEAVFGNNDGPADEAAHWTEGYLEKIYLDQVEMFKTVPNLVGVCPWLLFDYRSLGRMHSVYQQGYNRKGLLSEDGEKKKAWHVMKDYFADR